MKIFIVLPAYNESSMIAKVISGIKKEGYNNIVVVDDCSADNTYAVAKNVGVHALRHIVNRGAGATTKTGIDYALSQGADVIVTMDSDGQHSPKDIKGVVQPVLQKKADIVIGSRLVNRDEMPLHRKLGNFFGNLSTYILFGLWTTDSQSGFKAFSREAAEKIEIKTNRYEFCSEIFHEIKRKNLKFVEAPIQVIYTDYSLSKGQSFKNGLKTLFKMFMRRLLD